MNKAFVREPELDDRAYCPRCGSLGVAVGAGPLERYIRPEHRERLGHTAWFCGFAQCDVAYFDQLERVVSIDELRVPIYPKHPSAPICGCFGLTLDEVEADIAERSPTRIRDLLARSKSADAHCAEMAVDGQCCVRELQRLYMKGLANSE
jgi:hypothetical protein